MKNVIVFAVLLLGGCAGQATTAKPGSAPATAQLSAPFESGKTTLKDVEQALGEPNSSKPDAGGETLACYQYMRVSENPVAFMRVVGGGVENPDLTCCYRFASGGILDGVAAKSAKVQHASCPPHLHVPGSPLHLQPVTGAAKPVGP